jgi:homeobox protein homothorax
MNDQNPALHKKDKDAIYGHPLFPVLALLFEKCELATSKSKESSESGKGLLSSNAIDEDIKVFANLVRVEKPYYKADQEVDNLMINAISVLRIHLKELEKVDELSENFTQRYVNCLQGKLPVHLTPHELDFIED